VSQAEHDLQLKIWKELAISKQMLMRAATEALELDPECSQEELKLALDGLLKRIAKADADLAGAKEAAKSEIAALEKKLAAKEKELAAALAEARDAKAAHEAATQQLGNQRAAAATELQAVKERLAEREKALKAINTALADTPANVLQKMSTLKKQKQEEADARKQLDAAFNSLRSEKRQQDQKLAELQKNVATLTTRYRDLHALALQLRERAPAAAEGAEPLPSVPELDAKLIEAIEGTADGKKSERSTPLRAVSS
jgi:chromosome segregation ATPase